MIMKTILKFVSMIAAASAIVSCGGSETSQTPADALLERLSAQIEDGKIMFGHQDDLMYGHSWKIEDDADIFVQSDVKASCGKYPAVYGMDLGGIELQSPANLDKNYFDNMRKSAVAHHERGGITTFSWHPRNPLTGGDAWDVTSDQVVASILPGGEKHELFMGWLANAADFMESIKTADGQPIPLIFRPWHEHTGSWFWWGQRLCTTEQYKALWQMTYDYMVKERGMTQLVWAYSPGAGELSSAEVFGERYPGDEIIDMVGFDCYAGADRERYLASMKNALDITKAFAQEHGKLMAITETGYEGIKDPKWWTEVLYTVMKDYPVSYVLIWRNACDDNMQHHFYAPYPGHESQKDFEAFAGLDKMMFLETPRTELLSRLSGLIDQKKIMFGHQDTYLYGHSWKIGSDEAAFEKSDIKDVAGAYPALAGMDLGGIELDSPTNIDNNDFNKMRAAAVAHYLRGGVVTFSWHPRNPLTGGDTWDTSSKEVVASILPGGEKHEFFMGWLSKAADYLESIKTPDGKPVPVIFRPWHEHTRNFFWWGVDLCTVEQYKALWRMTYDYMTKERGFDHLVWSYSPDAGGLFTYEDFGAKYPGDDIIDMVGIDFYQFTPADMFIAKMKNSLDMTAAFAAEHGKLMAVTETGCEGIKNPKWWTEVLYPAIKDYPLSYVLTWRNACDEDMQHHFYAPFPGEESAEDFKAFAALDQIKFI